MACYKPYHFLPHLAGMETAATLSGFLRIQRLIISLVFIISSTTFVSLSHGGFPFPDDQANPNYLHKIVAVAGVESSSSSTSSMVLAANRTRRRDPLDHFRHYIGGWNISNQHYAYSVGFTAAPVFTIATIWFLGFGLCLLVICIRHCCFRKPTYGYSRIAYALSLAFIILFAAAVAIGSVVLYTGQGKFDKSTGDTLDYIVDKAKSNGEQLRNVSGYLSAAKAIRVDQLFLPPNVQNNIDVVDRKVNASIATLDGETENNSRKIKHYLKAVRIILIVISAVMLFLTLLGLALSILGKKLVVSTLVVIGWILVALTYIVCGVFLALHNTMGDTCVAMEEWAHHPTAHTALDDILPCIDNATARETLDQTRDVSFQLVGLVNNYIANISNGDFHESPKNPFYYNQSGPPVPLLCNPFYPDKSVRKCADGELDFVNAPEEWKKYICQVSADGICTTPGRITPTFYPQMTGASNVSYGLYYYGPFLVGLHDCTFVRDTFQDIVRDHCPGLKLYSKWVYIGLAMVSASVMFSLIFWVVYAREKRHRTYMKRFVALSDIDASSKVEPTA